MLNLRLRPSTSIRSLARRATAAAALFGLAVLGSACSGSPAGPDTLTAGRRVETGSGGGTLCKPPFCGVVGRIEIIAGGGSLNGPSVAAGSTVDFKVTSEEITGTGRFDGGRDNNASLSFSVTGETATIDFIWFDNGHQIFEAKDVTAPATVTLIADKACTSGTLVETIITATLENFGNTTITERHCAQ